MKDNRFKYRIKERRLFYLFIKYPKSHIYYVKIPEYNKTLSTGMTNLKAAYIKANEIYTRVSSNSVFKWESNDDFIISRLPSLPEKLTLQIIQKIQNELLETGITGKTVNNRMSWLHKYIDFPPVPHIKKVRIGNDSRNRLLNKWKGLKRLNSKFISDVHYLEEFEKVCAEIIILMSELDLPEYYQVFGSESRLRKDLSRNNKDLDWYFENVFQNVDKRKLLHLKGLIDTKFHMRASLDSLDLKYIRGPIAAAPWG